MSNVQQELKSIMDDEENIRHSWKETGQKQLLEFIVKFIPKLLGVESCSVFIHDINQGKVWLQCSTNLTEREIEVPKQGSLVGEVISTGQHQIRTDMDKAEGVHKKVDSKTGFVTRDILCVPIKSFTTDEVSGAIQILNKKGEAAYTDEDRSVLEEMAYYLQMLVEQAFISKKVATLSDKVRTKVMFADIMLSILAILAVITVIGGSFYLVTVIFGAL